jgi:hypothetical protein
MRKLIIFIVIHLLASAINAEAATTRIIVMPYKFVGNIDAKLDDEHKQRLAMADATFRTNLEKTQRYDLVDEAASKQFAEKVTAKLHDNDCQGCESALAKELNAKKIFVPYVYKLSQLVLTMHFVVLDVDTGKTVLKKALDFRGDNDNSWQHAIKYFIERVKLP